MRCRGGEMEVVGEMRASKEKIESYDRKNSRRNRRRWTA